MRPQQQNRRMRGRGNNNSGGGGNNNNNNQNRRGPNPLTRNYESNGPDVKIRGSAQQIADKYTTLARDAQSAGDRVIAENYLQHAEHYNRIIAAAQAQQPMQQQQRDRNDLDDDHDEDRDEFDQAAQTETPRPILTNDGSGPQPVIEGMPVEAALEQAAMNGANGHRENRANGEPAVAGDTPEDGQSRRPRRPRRNNRGRTERDGEAGEQNASSESGASDDSGPEGPASEPVLATVSGQD